MQVDDKATISKELKSLQGVNLQEENNSQLYRNDSKGAVIKYRTERGGRFCKNLWKNFRSNILASENPIPQQKSQHKFHAPTKSTPISLRQ